MLNVIVSDYKTSQYIQILPFGQFLLIRNTLKDLKVKSKVAGVKFPRPQNAYAFLMAGADLIETRAAPEIIDAIDQMRKIVIIPEYKNK